jgi:vibriolysin
MFNPRADRDPRTGVYSRDWYPDYWNTNLDNGGVHYNSGIANLFYFLLTQGGWRPYHNTFINGKYIPTIFVPGIGIEKARRIWYRALTAYMGPYTNYPGARVATALAARDLFGLCSPEYVAVQRGCDAVGVPGNWFCAPPPAPPGRRPRPGQFRRRQARHRRRRNQGHRRFLQYQAPGRNRPRLVQRHSRAC